MILAIVIAGLIGAVPTAPEQPKTETAVRQAFIAEPTKFYELSGKKKK